MAKQKKKKKGKKEKKRKKEDNIKSSSVRGQAATWNGWHAQFRRERKDSHWDFACQQSML